MRQKCRRDVSQENAYFTLFLWDKTQGQIHYCTLLNHFQLLDALLQINFNWIRHKVNYPNTVIAQTPWFFTLNLNNAKFITPKWNLTVQQAIMAIKVLL